MQRPTSGYVYQIGKSAISKSSQKQATVAKSSTEAEYVALSSATQEVICLRHFHGHLGKRMDVPVVIYEDNEGVIELTKNAKYYAKSNNFVKYKMGVTKLIFQLNYFKRKILKIISL